jgi:hypothetical protein
MRRLNRTDRRRATDEKSGLAQGKEAATASEELIEETRQRQDGHTRHQRLRR